MLRAQLQLTSGTTNQWDLEWSHTPENENKKSKQVYREYRVALSRLRQADANQTPALRAPEALLIDFNKVSVWDFT